MNEQHDRSITTAIKRMAGTWNQQNIKVGTGNVVSVNAEERTCMVLTDNDVEINCKLMAQIGDGMLLIPSVDSTVLILYATYTDAYVMMCSDVDSISFKGSELGGLVKVVDLTSRLNKIEQDINNLKQAFSNWVVVPSDGGAALKTVAASWYGSQLTKTQRSDIENENVTHGN